MIAQSARPDPFNAWAARISQAGADFPSDGPAARSSSKCDAAIAGCGRGFAVFPCKPNTKDPAIKNWPNLATVDVGQIKSWWRQWPDANIGAVTTPLLVVDADTNGGGDVSLQSLELVEDFPDTLRSRTRSGGEHVIYRLPDHTFVRNSVKAIAPGIDIRSWHGFIVLPGSSIDGRSYEWLNDKPIAMAPRWLIERCKAARTRSANAGKRVVDEDDTAIELAFTWLARHAPIATEGERDNTAFGVAARLYDFAVAPETCADLLAQWNRGHCFPPLEDADIARIADSASRNRDKKIGSAHPAAPGFTPYEMGSVALASIESRGLKIKGDIARDTFENAMCAVAQAGIAPAWDELRQNFIFRAENLPWQEHFGRVLDDHVLRLIRLYLMNKHQGVIYSPSKGHLLEAIKTVAYGAKFNPVTEYLDSLTWDGVERAARLFPRYFNCDDDEYSRAVSQCFLVGAVRRMRKPGCKFDTMPVLRGPQGWGKSTAVKTLFGADWYSDADLGSLRDKDSAMILRGVWVQEFAEIASLTRAETGALKAFCSRATDRQRDPYATTVSDVPRRCVFLATVNEGGYLKDSTGGRRFWPLTVAAPIDGKQLAADRNQLWAEAVVLEAQGTSNVLPSALWPVAAERQAEQTSGDPWADTLRDFLDRRAADFKRPQDGSHPPPPNRVHTVELFGALRISVADQNKDKAQRLRTVMEAGLGWCHRPNVRVRDKNLAGYVRENPSPVQKP